MRPGEHWDERRKRMVRHTDKKAKAGKDLIAQCARLAWGRAPPCVGPVLVRVVAIFSIPPSWPAKVKKAAQEGRVLHIADPDLDQLIKQVKDALVGIAYVDDNQVAGYPNPAKRYGTPERTEITIEQVEQAPDEITPGQRRVEARAIKAGLVPPRPNDRPRLGLRFPSNAGRSKGA